MTKKDIWNKNDEKKYYWLFNHFKKTFPNLDEFSYIDTYKRKLMSIIEKNEKWSNKSKEALLFMIAKYLRTTTNKNKLERYAKMYSQAAYELMLENRKEENSNKQDEKELLNYRDHKYFVDILKSIDYENIKTLTSHLQYILLSLLIYQPPVRTDFYVTASFIKSKKDNDNIHNFIKIDRKGSLKIFYIINKDKVTSTKTYNMNKNLSKIEIKDKDLCKLIYDSYKRFPRKYLFEINEKQISPPTFLNWLRKITNVDNINNDIMRSSYINWFYSTERNMNEKEELAHQMRNSIETAQSNFLKIFDETKESDCDKLKETVIELQNENKEITQNLDNVAPKENGKLYIKRRRDLVYQLNKYNRIVKESSLLKYNITFDKNLKNMFKKYFN
jgi:hypothetical protein